MAKQVLMYGSIYQWSAAEVIKNIADASSAGDDLLIRVNTDGGDPHYTWGMAAAFDEFEGEKHVVVDGKAYSCGLFFVCYADKVTAYDFSEFLVHRAAYPSYMESDPNRFTDEIRANLERVNKSLRAAFEAKIDVAKFEAMKGVKVKDIFSMESRIDVFLTAKEAKAIGLVSEIKKISAEKMAANHTAFLDHGGFGTPQKAIAKAEEIPSVKIETINTVNMTFDELKASHPAIFAQAVTVGVEQEKDRAGAWAVHIETDPKAVAEGIKSGEPLSATATQELMQKQFAGMQAKALEGEAPAPTGTPKVKIEGKETELDTLSALLDAELSTGKTEVK